ncbi:4a-hydroxytetrahydrobiopterin dehydratase [Thermobifida halotolerans]|uniref:Putative pterin-4-alpha-carbinolamine dehydratase n=1 Tax=Thermobifida halotolerans TaxID=483545 RepID=A0A399G6Z4_9ACTN|nr:4a-hydroxytetrahydrobiopterin dehydratase [Thermobifida halotolerans]UOE21055.1 4a-hydroxytetrahydrobiopterin dehydratase [Thermobifida halotolerans]
MRVLSEEEISTALASLAHWEHQADALARLAPTDDPAGMRAAVDSVSGAERDHVATRAAPNGLVVRVATPGAGVTDTDVELAARIEQTIEMGGSDARPQPPGGR